MTHSLSLTALALAMGAASAAAQTATPTTDLGRVEVTSERDNTLLQRRESTASKNLSRRNPSQRTPVDRRQCRQFLNRPRTRRGTAEHLTRRHRQRGVCDRSNVSVN